MRARSAILGPDGMPVRASAFQAASTSHPALARWRPGLTHHQSALSWSRTAIQARVGDLVRNDGWASAAVSRYVSEVVGCGWRLSAKPVASVLGLDPEAAGEVADQIEALWSVYTAPGHLEVDAERSHHFGGLIGLAMRHYVRDGEAFGLVTAREDNPLAATCLQVVHPDRVGSPLGSMDSARLRMGVETDDFGAPVAYHVRVAHPADTARIADAWRFERVPRHVDGRPVMLHAFSPAEAGDRRGVSRFAPIVRKLRQVTQFDDVELQAATLNAVMAAFVTSPFDPEAASESLTARTGDAYSAKRAEWAEANPIEMDGVQVASLYDGEDIKTVKAEHPNANFEPFVNAALRNIASAVGLTYEQMTMDWSQVNYSSARAAMLTIYRAFDADRDGFAARFVQPFYQAWLAEMIEAGMLTLPPARFDFAAMPPAWAHAEWIGPGRGWVDPGKEAQAAAFRVGAGLSTLEAEAAQQGRDWREDALQRHREQRFLAELGLTPAGDTRLRHDEPQADDETDAETDAIPEE